MPIIRFPNQIKSAVQNAVIRYSLLPELIPALITKASHAAARVPKVFPQDWPKSGIMTAHIGFTPIPIRSGAPTATGTPNPVMPWRKLSKIHPMASTKSSSFGSSLLIPSRITRNALVSLPT